VSNLSIQFTLQPGDVIATGTPEVVGWFRNPKLLRDGDTVAVELSGIGKLENVGAFRSPSSDANRLP
jgi:acylpyruvate hydrolase